MQNAKSLTPYACTWYNIPIQEVAELSERKSTQAHIDANARYDKKAYDNVLVKFRKDAVLTLAAVKEHAASRGESTNGFIVRAITEAIERDTQVKE